MRGPAALVETAGTSRWCNALLQSGLEPGDQVLVHAGLVIHVLSAEQAREIEDAFAELARPEDAIGWQSGATPDDRHAGQGPTTPAGPVSPWLFSTNAGCSFPAVARGGSCQ